MLFERKKLTVPPMSIRLDTEWVAAALPTREASRHGCLHVDTRYLASRGRIGVEVRVRVRGTA